MTRYPSWGCVVEELLSSLHDRLDAYLVRGDASMVLADQAETEAVELLAAARAQAGDGGISLEPVVVAAWLYWCRFLAFPDGQGDEDRRLALGFFDVIRKVDPEVVPHRLDPAGARAEQAAAILAWTGGNDDPAALEHAVDLLYRAVRAVPADHPDRADWLANLSVALRTRFSRLDDLSDLNAAVTAGQEAVATMGVEHDYRPSCLSILGNALRVRFERLGDLADLDAAVAAQQEAVAAAPVDSPERAMFLSSLGGALQLRFGRLHDVADLDAAIAASRASVEATPADDPGRGKRLSNLGLALAARFEHFGDLADIDAAVDLSRAVVDATPAGHPERAGFLSNLGMMFRARYYRLGGMTDLDAAVTACQSAVELTPTGNTGRPMLLSNLGDLLRARFERTHDLTDLDSSIAALREAIAATPANSPEHAARLSNLGLALRSRFEQTGHKADIDTAVTVSRGAVDATPADHPEQAKYLSGLCLGLLARFEQDGNVADIDAAVTAGREAVASSRSSGTAERAGCLSDLSAALSTRFQRTGDVADLDAAIAAIREAVEVTPADYPRRRVYLHNLSFALETRFERDGELADLDAAVTAERTAVATSPEGDSEQALYLSHLGVVLRRRFERAGDVADIDAAVAAGREAVDAVPPNHPDRAMCLSMYGGTAHTRFKHTGDVADIDTAVAAGREAVDAVPANHAGRPTYLSNLGTALRDRYARLGREADLNAAIAASQEAVTTVPADHPFRARFLYVLGNALRARFTRTEDMADADAALTAWRAATSVTSAPTSVRMEAGRAWGVLSASLGRWADAVRGYAQAVELLPLLAWLGAGRRSREHLLADWGGLATDAAACAVAAGQADRAVELLELGRGVLWSQLLETRTDLTALRQAHPDLAAQLESLRAELDRPSATSSSATDDVDTRMTAARRWQMLLDAVRAQPGFHDFARAPTAARLRHAATGGTVVIVNVSQWRCDALLVTETGIRITELPALTNDTALERTNAYLIALQDFETNRSDSLVARLALEQTITSTLGWLWDSIAEPILRHLGHRATPSGEERWPRVWWCSTGALTVLPLHAAGHHDRADGRAVLDRVVSSYASTLRGLSTARARPKATTPSRLLLIALPNTPGLPSLPAVAAEQTLLTTLFDDTRCTVLADADATRTRILHELASHAWTHASCHGDQDLADPTTGGLLPYDWDTAGRIGILDLTADSHLGGEFMFLSACKTATGGVANLDEAINLAAAVHHVGWRHVIGTLWTVADTTAADITRDTYPHLVRDSHLDPTHTAEALHHALRAHRDKYRGGPSRWAPFLHIGP